MFATKNISICRESNLFDDTIYATAPDFFGSVRNFELISKLINLEEVIADLFVHG
jgi:hypothetical protein